jgi:hypothetical protein
MSGKVTTQFSNETLTDEVLESPVDCFERGLRRRFLVGLAALLILLLLWLGAKVVL